MRVVIDTNVLRAGVYSANGASFQLLRSLPHTDVEVILSVTLYLEYQAVLTRPEHLPPNVTPERMLGFLRRFAAICQPQAIYFLWRPWLRDADDDMVLELAVAGAASHVITLNVADFAGIEAAFGIRIVTPAEFMALLRSRP